MKRPKAKYPDEGLEAARGPQGSYSGQGGTVKDTETLFSTTRS
jgi:hypothetical protein